MGRTSHHTIERRWDAPFEAVRIAYAYTPRVAATKPSFGDAGDPGEPEYVEPLLCRARIAGVWHDMPEYFLEEMGKLLEDEMIAEARDEIEEHRSYARAEAREWEAA